jgi:hypothetical protein
MTTATGRPRGRPPKPPPLERCNVNDAASSFEGWLRDHGIRYVRQRKNAMQRDCRAGALIDFLVLGPPARQLAVLFKSDRAKLTEQQEELLAYLAAAGWRTTTCGTGAEAVQAVVHVALGGVHPEPKGER